MADKSVRSSGNDFVVAVDYGFGGVRPTEPSAGLPDKKVRQDKKRKRIRVDSRKRFCKHPTGTNYYADVPKVKLCLLYRRNLTSKKPVFFLSGIKNFFGDNLDGREKSEKDKSQSGSLFVKQSVPTCKDDYHFNHEHDRNSGNSGGDSSNTLPNCFYRFFQKFNHYDSFSLSLVFFYALMSVVIIPIVIYKMWELGTKLEFGLTCLSFGFLIGTDLNRVYRRFFDLSPLGMPIFVLVLCFAGACCSWLEEFVSAKELFGLLVFAFGIGTGLNATRRRRL